MSQFPYKPGDAGQAIRDINRKLASLDPKGEPDLVAFKTGPWNGHFTAETAIAISAFRRNNGEANPPGVCDEATWNLLNIQAGTVFGEAWQFEVDALRGGPITDDREVEPVRDSLVKEAHDHKFAGLAFSGGGIRSATFNLGILQALAELRMLKDFDYLSTVSGGGYIGGWFTKWLKRQDGRIDDIEQSLTPGANGKPKSEPEELKFLRQYTNYLTPKTGFFSADTWALLGTYLRNTTLNLTILALILAGAMVLPRLLALFLDDPANNPTVASFVIPWIAHFSVFSGIAVGSVLWSVFWIAASISGVPNPKSKLYLWRQSQNSIIWFIVVPLMVAAFFGSAELWKHHEDVARSWGELFSKPSVHNPIIIWLWAPGVAYFCAWAAGWIAAQIHNLLLRAKEAGKATPGATSARAAKTLGWFKQGKALGLEAVGHFACAMIVFAVGTTLVIVSTSALAEWHHAAPTPRTPAKLSPAAAQTVAAAHQVTAAAQSVKTSASTITALANHSPVPAAAGAPALAHHGASTTVPLLAFGMPILLSLFGVTMILSVGLVGRLYTDKSREWWSRQSGWTTICVTAWFALVTVSLYAPAVVGYGHAKMGDLASAAVGSTWLATTLLGLVLGQSGATGSPDRKSRLDWLARAAPLLFSVGAVFIISSLLHALLLPRTFVPAVTEHSSFIEFLADYDRGTLATESTPSKLWFTLAGLLLAGTVLAWRVDINKFSLHMMYRNRLSRAYLGASNKERRAHPFTGFDPADDEHLDSLLKSSDDQIIRPYHIVNTALNLVNGHELAWQTRKAANFTFTPAFCGFELPPAASPGGRKTGGEAMRGGFRRTAAYRPEPGTHHDEERGIKLGMAVAVSGAAASPSMGYHSSPPLAFLMTLFNVRLGRWFANPTRPVSPRQAKAQLKIMQTRAEKPLDSPVQKNIPAPHTPRTSPPFGLWYLLRELFGLTDAKSSFVYLSDGGHFENLGIYELVRRRCRLIVVIDAGADGQFDFEDLGNAIRKCATDLHVEVEIDVGKIDLAKAAEFSVSHCVTGAIRYDKVDWGGQVGTLLYIKPSLLGTEFADVLNYRKTNKSFPHQPTADQWFDETQFETYRSLGYNIGKKALQEAAQAVKQNDQGRRDIAALCEALEQKWSGAGAEKITPPPTPVAPLRLVSSNRRMAGRRKPHDADNRPAAVATERRVLIDRRWA